MIDCITLGIHLIHCLLQQYLLYLKSCETRSLTLKEECRLRVFENWILGQIFGLKREANGQWRRLYNEELHGLYPLSNILRVIKSRRLRWAGHVAIMERQEYFQNFNRQTCRKGTTKEVQAQMRGSYQDGPQRNRYQYEKLG